MIQQFLEAKTDEGLPLPEGDIRSEAMNMMSAGADTTSIAINAIIGYLLQKPEKMAEVQEEIDSYYKKNNLPDHRIAYNQCLEMPLLQAVIKESMRLHPSIQFQLPRLSPPEGITIAGYFIPSNYAVGINPKSHNRSKEIFGDDAETWRPERWLEDEERAKSMDSLLVTWGFGSRTCVGKNIALVELNMFIAQFLRQFDVFVVDKENPFTVYTMWFSMQRDFWVTLRARDLKNVVKSGHA